MTRRISRQVEGWIEESLSRLLPEGAEMTWDCTVEIGSAGPEVHVVFFRCGPEPALLGLVIPDVLRATRFDVEGTVREAVTRLCPERHAA